MRFTFKWCWDALGTFCIIASSYGFVFKLCIYIFLPLFCVSVCSMWAPVHTSTFCSMYTTNWIGKLIRLKQSKFFIESHFHRMFRTPRTMVQYVQNPQPVYPYSLNSSLNAYEIENWMEYFVNTSSLAFESLLSLLLLFIRMLYKVKQWIFCSFGPLKLRLSLAFSFTTVKPCFHTEKSIITTKFAKTQSYFCSHFVFIRTWCSVSRLPFGFMRLCARVYVVKIQCNFIMIIY